MASIHDVAKHAGFSTSTISRVLNNRDAVGPETRRKVLQAIHDLGYKPNLVAQGLRVRRGRLIGLVVPMGTAPVFSMIIQHALEAARSRGYDIVLVNSNEDPELEQELVADLSRRNINGIIFSRVSDESRIVPRTTEDVPIVIIDRALEHEKVASVVLNNYTAGRIAAQHLLDLGHTRIAIVTGSLKIALCRDRMRGFQEALREAGIELPASRVFEGDFKLNSGRMAVRELLRDSGSPAAVWAMNDMMAFGVLKELAFAGARVPADVSVLGMDDTEYCDIVTPALTSVHYPFKELAESAVRILLSQIEDGRISRETTQLEPGLTIRESTRRAG